MPKSFFRRYKYVLMAAPLLAFPVWEYWLLAREVEGFVRETGVVVGHEEVRSPTAFPMYHSIIQYSGPGGSNARFVDEVKRRPAEPIGKRIPVLVDPRTRAVAYRAGLRGYWFWLTITTLLAVGMFIVAVCVTWVTRRDASRRLARRRAGGRERRTSL